MTTSRGVALLLCVTLSCTGSPSADGGNSADAGTLSGDGGSEVSASPHTPDGGCGTGFEGCGDVCAEVSTDSRHCGGCGHDCASPDGGGFGFGCVAGQCVSGQGCVNDTISCEGACVDPRTSVDDCGSCANRCADRELCVGRGECVSALGSGSSCASPLVLPEKGLYTFRFTPAVVSAHVFPCGPLSAVPTRWFRFTATKTGSMTAEVKQTTDDTVLEVFSSPTCDQAGSLACNDDQALGNHLPFVTFHVVTGQTYFLAVGQVTGASGGLPLLKLND